MSRQVFNQETQVWDVIYEDLPFTPRTTEELASNARSYRGGLLSQTDWSSGTDVTMTEGMRAYRQALRDVPQQAGFPSTVTWPTKPSGL